MTVRRWKGEETRYVSRREAISLGIAPRTLRDWTHKGFVRTQPEVPAEVGRVGRPGYRYHIDDLNRCRWPKMTELVAAAGISKGCMTRILRQFHIPGLHRVGGRWLVDPQHVPCIVRWLRDGRPVRPPFLPK